MRIATTGYARTAIAIVRVRISDDGTKGVSRFDTQSPGMTRALQQLIKLGVLRRVDAPKGELAVSPGTNWQEASA